MSSNLLGLIELLLVFGAVFGFGFWQLRSLRRLRERDQGRHEKPRDDDAEA